ncbi:hypothetical protein I5Q34_00455 [Streptomyces sp. AV19]|uniref:hypothetical protein n=1 Tax=Streptomyces sp. AV19 TaxID=2793068 RepID=UPI0018FF0EFD|nr:hypothetical protein [Streptomyces sp. AV19]MBH1932779.1 hypothetical protein [Streptomyces sp. AV19]MDG4531449.1 hypothetical protein [Streptomyces sp. AV19]
MGRRQQAAQAAIAQIDKATQAVARVRDLLPPPKAESVLFLRAPSARDQQLVLVARRRRHEEACHRWQESGMRGQPPMPEPPPTPPPAAAPEGPTYNTRQRRAQWEMERRAAAWRKQCRERAAAFEEQRAAEREAADRPRSPYAERATVTVYPADRW